jgi:heavy metal translocating P-type ATPase
MNTTAVRRAPGARRAQAPPLEGSSALILAATASALVAGGAAWLAGRQALADAAWALAIVAALVPLTISVARDLVHRETGVDLIALLAMGGALLLGQFLPGAVIGLMLSGGQALERYASGRARRELSMLLARAPRAVLRHEGEQLVSRPVEAVVEGDLLLVRPGEVVPVDGAVASELAVLDESALTGESLPVEHDRGGTVRSGTVNAGAPFDLLARSDARSSTYAGLIRLVREAQETKAPFVRLADRFALWFLAATLSISALAWAVSGDPVRALAVLVVATPCPLILAAPVAIVAGLSRSAHRGVIVKGGGPLETMARARTVLIDKTGTLTHGLPRVTSVEAFAGLPPDDVVRLAASLDQVSPHVFAQGIVAAARERGLELELPERVQEVAGKGIEGYVGRRHVALGRLAWLAERQAAAGAPAGTSSVERDAGGASRVYVAVDRSLAGVIVMEDQVRAETPGALRRLREAGVARIVLLSGDRREVAERVGRAVGVDRVLYEQSPEQKIEAVGAERRRAVTVMVGDGINDAPALAAADVGVAMGARGATASSEAADAVIIVDRLDRVADALVIARRSRGIAMQSVVAGMALSIAGMVLATFGLLPPLAGALFQEAIDVAVILNALRALR